MSCFPLLVQCWIEAYSKVTDAGASSSDKEQEELIKILEHVLGCMNVLLCHAGLELDKSFLDQTVIILEKHVFLHFPLVLGGNNNSLDLLIAKLQMWLWQFNARPNEALLLYVKEKLKDGSFLDRNNKINTSFLALIEQILTFEPVSIIQASSIQLFLKHLI